MKKTLILLGLISVSGAAFIGCTTETSTAAGTNTPPTTVVKTTGLDPATIQQIDTLLNVINSNAPAAIAEAQAIKNLVHGTN